MFGPEKFSRPVRFAFIVSLVLITWLVVVVIVTLAGHALVDISTGQLMGRNG